MREYRLPDSHELEERAMRCRTLAAGVTHKATRDRLIRIADEYEVLARQFSRAEQIRQRERRKLIQPVVSAS